MHRRKEGGSSVSGIGFGGYVGGGDTNRCAAHTDCMGGGGGVAAMVGFVVRDELRW